jgi:leucyl/phenylalanyl-tRNA--protein transferase
VDLASPEGLLAVGGDLRPQRLIEAYRHGIFPWYSDGQPILWWSPDPRTVLFPGNVRVSRSLRKVLRSRRFEIRLDRNFREVITACALPRRGGREVGTWITAEMIEAYCVLHALGVAHSVEIFAGDELVGGLYGVALGRAFFGESMFSAVSNASKVALVFLARQLAAWGFELIDCQMPSEHLFKMGAVSIPRRDFVARLLEAANCDAPPGPWDADPGLVLS